MSEDNKLNALRKVINENLRVQLGGATSIEYVDVSNALGDVASRQNHVIFGRRGCGKTLLLHAAHKIADRTTRIVYVNCEDYKQHSFPNVLIEILDRLFAELQRNLSGWFGRKKRSRELIAEIRNDLSQLKESADERSTRVKEITSSQSHQEGSAGLTTPALPLSVSESLGEKSAIQR
jgi:DNA-binding NtrC family response regulator